MKFILGVAGNKGGWDEYQTHQYKTLPGGSATYSLPYLLQNTIHWCYIGGKVLVSMVGRDYGFWGRDEAISAQAFQPASVGFYNSPSSIQLSSWVGTIETARGFPFSFFEVYLSLTTQSVSISRILYPFTPLSMFAAPLPTLPPSS